MTKNEIRQTQKENTVGPKCEVPGVAGFTETERGRAGVTGWGRGLLFNGNRASVWGDEMSSGDDGGDGCTHKLMYLMPPNCAV